jgi:hypothetical protein
MSGCIPILSAWSVIQGFAKVALAMNDMQYFHGILINLIED